VASTEAVVDSEVNGVPESIAVAVEVIAAPESIEDKENIAGAVVESTAELASTVEVVAENSAVTEVNSEDPEEAVVVNVVLTDHGPTDPTVSTVDAVRSEEVT
jgi:cytidine deaminase